MAVAAPANSNGKKNTNEVRNKTDVDACKVDPDRLVGEKLHLEELENRGYCHYKLCKNKYGNKNGGTRNPDVIYRIICEETPECKQAYLTVELEFTKGTSTFNTTEEIPAGCIYSVIDLGQSTTLEEATIDYVS
jgi:hypothetical protein